MPLKRLLGDNTKSHLPLQPPFFCLPVGSATEILSHTLTQADTICICRKKQEFSPRRA